MGGFPPIGSLTKNFYYYLLNGNRQIAEGEIGELCLGGPCVGQGYVNQAELTQKAFVDDPFSVSSGKKIYRTGDLMRFNPEDGKLWFVGRKDFQIKHQGHRIELEEIEHALVSISEVNEAAAVHTIDEEISKIIAFITTNRGMQSSEIRKQVARLVPKYMVPNKVYVLEQLPKNANGKTDRRRLRDLYLTTEK